MAWVKLDDGFPDHPKVAQAGDFAAWLYVCGLTYANRLLTDGFIPGSVVPRLTGLKNPMALATRLVTAGLWEQAEGGYQIHDYLTYQPAAGKVAQEREANAARVAAWKRRQNGTTNEGVTPLPEHYQQPGVMPLAKVPREEEEVEPGKRAPEDVNLELGPEAVGAAAPPAAADESLDRVNQALTGQPGWTVTPEQLHKLSDIATSQRLDFELEALKIVDWLKSPKGKGRQCSFRFVANWLETGARPPPAYAGAPATNGTGPKPRGSSRAKHH